MFDFSNQRVIYHSMSQYVRDLFDSIAPRYDLLNSLLSLRTDRHWRRHAVGRLKEKRFESVLDLCAGTLSLTIALLTKNHHCHVTAVDFSKSMLEKGKSNLPLGLGSRVSLVTADAMKLSFPSHTFNAVMCAYGMRNVDNNEVVLQSILNLLKPGGRFVMLEFFQPEGVLSKLFNLTYAQFMIPVIGKVISKNAHAYQYLRDSVRNFYTPTAYKELLKSIGFEKITVKALSGGITHLITAEVPQ